MDMRYFYIISIIYKDYAILERCYLGDTVTVIEDKLNINISVRAIKKKYDVLRQ
ncbi:hypothetical protein [Clostridium sp.]|uniref:hypothetical protein n=1 Tax=Clostridium sp. TaxID=1506 RepID=UPI003217756B